MNNVTITGHLTDEPKLKHIGDGRALCEMRVAVDNGRHPTTYIDAVAFDGQAYACAEYLAKGRKVGVEGRLALGEWHDAAGRLHQRYSVIGRVEFLGRPPSPEPTAEADVLGRDPDADPTLALAA
ncbi:MAG TPA: single-stranded DNA-binding protein [Solirubrobacterales bacterium]|jgi:single-strand DNA-binding protein|nr:single-stranded DNA-binding protein [Solirubrobacterales bacterium]